MGFGAVLILFPAWIPDEKSVPMEDSVVETLQSALLAFSAALLFATAPHAGPFRAVYRSLGFLTVAFLIAARPLFRSPCLRLRRTGSPPPDLLQTLHFIGFASRHPASGFILAALILNYAFSRVFGSQAFWQASLREEYNPDIPPTCRGYLELLACYFILLGTIGYCLPLIRRRYRMFTEP